MRLFDTKIGKLFCFPKDRANDPVMGFHDGVRNGRTPLHDTDRHDGQAAVTGDIEEPVGEVPLTLAAQTRANVSNSESAGSTRTWRRRTGR